MRYVEPNGGGGSAHQWVSGAQTFLDKVAALADDDVDQVTSIEYDRRALAIKQTDAERFVTSRRYDLYGQLAAEIRTILNGKTTTTQFDYDLRGALLRRPAMWAGSTSTTRLVYDAFGRVVQSIDGAGKVTATSYQDSGRTIVVSDPLNRAVRTEYDAYSRVVGWWMRPVSRLATAMTIRHAA